jgi:uncharacterized small protein (DUF1192 family)
MEKALGRMNLPELVENIFTKVERLAKKLHSSEQRNAELWEDNRELSVLLTQYTDRVGELEMEVVQLKKELERFEKSATSKKKDSKSVLKEE